MAWSGIGLWASPHVEQKLGLVPTEQEKEELQQKIRVNIKSVEK
jgi:hypothetical protein